MFLSRVQRRRKHLRLEKQGLLKAETWCAIQRVDFSDLVDALLRVFNAGLLPKIGRPDAQLDAQAPTSDRSDDLTEEEDIDQLSSSMSSLPIGRPGAQNDPQDAESKRVEEIIAFYSVVTGNRALQADRDALRKIFDLSDDVINTGILRSVIYCTDRVGSFRYCLKAIKQISTSRIDPKEEFWRMYETFFAKVRGGQVKLPGEGAALLEGRFGKAE